MMGVEIIKLNLDEMIKDPNQPSKSGKKQSK